jgi:hypothetical protein
MGYWLMETLRGEIESFNDSMQHLGVRLNRDLSTFFHVHRMPLIVIALVIQHDGLRAFGGNSNMQADGTVLRNFEYQMNEITAPDVFGQGSGAPYVVKDHLDLLREQLGVRPRNPRDHMKLLATVNRRVAKVEKGVSSHCHVAFINGDDRFGPMSETFADRGTPLPFSMGVLFAGIDLSLMVDKFVEARKAGIMPSYDPDEINENLKRRP